MRNMSFSKTTEQVRNKTKTVTRRFGWWFLKPGDRVQAVEKAMGLKKGEKVKRICVIEIVSVRAESECAVTKAECVLEGFPDMSALQFRAMLWEEMCPQKEPGKVNRIKFKYVD